MIMVFFLRRQTFYRLAICLKWPEQTWETIFVDVEISSTTWRVANGSPIHWTKRRQFLLGGKLKVRARIFKILRNQGIDSLESILVLLKRLQIRAQWVCLLVCTVYCRNKLWMLWNEMIGPNGKESYQCQAFSILGRMFLGPRKSFSSYPDYFTTLP